MRDAYENCLNGLKRHIIRFTYAWMPFEDHMDNMLAPADGQLYKSIVNKIYTRPGAFDRIKNWKELYKN